MLRLVEDELRRYPNSCFSKNLRAWYNAVYTALSYLGDCSYQVDIDETQCMPQMPTSIDQIILEVDFLLIGVERRDATRMLRRLNREARRSLIQDTARAF